VSSAQARYSQPGRQQRSLSPQVLPDQIHQSRDARLVRGGEALPHGATHAKSEDQEWNEHDGSGGEEDAGAEGHGEGEE
jgi:hypothetical protein